MLVSLKSAAKRTIIRGLLFELFRGNLNEGVQTNQEEKETLEIPIEEAYLKANELWKILKTTLGSGYLENDNNINYSQEEVIIIDDAVYNYQEELLSFYREESATVKSYYIGGAHSIEVSGSLRLWAVAVYLQNIFNDGEMLANIRNQDYWFSSDRHQFTECNRVNSLLSYLIQFLPRPDDDEYDSYMEESRQGFSDFYEGDPDNLWNTD